ncbi:MAG: aminopeptidase [Bacillales bacterium]|jgi:aminopeptidase|nr:aminopeptidase [Bacillales bacterium]
MKETVLKKYAKLIIKMGVNLKKGQLLVVNAPVESYPLVDAVVEQGYLAGAKTVLVLWSDIRVTRQSYLNESEEILTSIPEYVKQRYDYITEQSYAVVNISSSNPSALNGIDPNKQTAVMKALQPIIAKYRDNAMKSVNQWTIAAYPNQEWANKVFPNLNNKQAYKALQDAILMTSRMSGNPLANWKEHNNNLLKRSQWLNDLGLQYLHITSSNGTDLKVYLADTHIWIGGQEKTPKGVLFNPNIPTEECFTMPHSLKTSGIVYSTKPLSYQGQLIEDFSLTFKEGVVVKYQARVNEASLKALLDSDEGSKRIGEIALVPYHSPISESKILFYQTLFDENASCHLALGRAYPTNVVNGEKLSQDGLSKLGANASINHVDFMIGASDTKIVGYKKDGSQVNIFINGDWA